jgi:hypothetical protein
VHVKADALSVDRVVDVKKRKDRRVADGCDEAMVVVIKAATGRRHAKTWKSIMEAAPTRCIVGKEEQECQG